jgi:aldehyde dehydrogenase (NAD+)/coniferyl-aldehyde dehydrogenase
MLNGDSKSGEQRTRETDVREPGTDAGGSDLLRVLERLREQHRAEPYPAVATRRKLLSALERLLEQHSAELARAVAADFGHRSVHDTRLGDIWLPLSQIRYLRSRVAVWAQPEHRAPLWVFRPGRARVVYQPKGVVGIISPWNYPVMLAISPLAGALAAGNRVMLKLSEHVSRTSELLARVLERELPHEFVQVVLGGAEVGQAFAELPFDHLLFTGGESVGRKVALAAAKNLVPVTLELGGKCPAILQRGFSVERFAARIVQGKCYSAGQSCVAPDYLLVPRESVSQVVEQLQARVKQCFGTLRDNPDYSAVATPERKQRLLRLLDEAVQKGASQRVFNPADEVLDQSQKMALVALWDVPDDASVMREEIFGPLLPIVPYDTFDDALRYVNARPRPLALYYFDEDGVRIGRVLTETISGGVTINDTLLHFLCDSLPREGTGASGNGAYFGRRSFETFSHSKSVFLQSRFSGVGTFAPPYGRFIEWMLKNVLRA